VAYLALRYRLTSEFSNQVLNYIAKILRHKWTIFLLLTCKLCILVWSDYRFWQILLLFSLCLFWCFDAKEALTSQIHVQVLNLCQDYVVK
jgi:hypothetical protein